MPRSVVAHERDGVALVRMCNDESGLAWPVRHCRQDIKQLTMIMTVDFHDSEPECGRFLIKWFKIIGLAYGCSLLQPVAVHDDREPIKLVMGCGHHGLPIAALLQL